MIVDPMAWAEGLGYRGILRPDGTRHKVFGRLHREMFDALERYKRVSLVVSRKHAKSTVIQNKVSHTLLTDSTARIIYCSATTALACEMIGEIRDRLNGRLWLGPEFEEAGWDALVPDVFPWLKPTRKGEGPCDFFNIAGRSGGGRESSVFASSLGSAKAGKRPTHAAVDDPSNELNSTSAVQAEKPIDGLIQLEPMMRDGPDSPIWVASTPWRFYDVSEFIRQSPEKWHQIRYGCWDGVNPSTGQKDGKGPGPDGAWPLCESFMSAAELIEEQAYLESKGKSSFFKMQYEVEPAAGENPLFVGGLMDQITTGTVADLPEGPAVLCWDPTSHDKAQAGSRNGITIWRVLSAADVRKSGRFSIPCLADMAPETALYTPLAAFEMPGDLDTVFDHLPGWVERFGIKSIWLENTASAGGIKAFLGRSQWIREARVNVVPIKIGTNGASKAQRLQNVRLGMTEGRIFFTEDFENRALLVRHLLEFPNGAFDDVPDSCSLLSNSLRRTANPMLDKQEKEYYNAAADPTSLAFNPRSANPRDVLGW